MTKSIRDQIRAATVGAKPEFKSEVVEYAGIEVEIRQPSQKDRKELMKKCQDKDGRLDPLEFTVWAVIRNTFVPGTNERVFESGDYDKMIEMPAGGFIDQFGEKAMDLFNSEGKATQSSDEMES